MKGGLSDGCFWTKSFVISGLFRRYRPFGVSYEYFEEVRPNVKIQYAMDAVGNVWSFREVVDAGFS